MKYSDKTIYLTKKGQKPTASGMLKKVGTGILSAAVCMTSVLTTVPTYALTDPDNRSTYLEFTFDGSNPMLASDNETSAATNTTMGTDWADSTTISGFSGINSDIHKNVYKMGASDTLDFGVYGTINLPGKKMEAKPHIVSFEFLPMQDNVQYITQMMATSGEVEVLFTVGSNGICGFSKAGGWNGSNPSTESATFAAAPYNVGQWNTIDIVINPETRVRKYYINGEFCGDNTGSEKYTGLLTFMSFATGKDRINGKIDPENSGLLFDNVSVNYLNDNSFYSRATVDGDKVRVDFSETPTEKLKNITLYDSTADSIVSVSDVKSCGKTLTFKTNGDLDKNRQYVIIYPEEFSSVGGHKISDRYMYFYPETPTGVYAKYASVTDFFGNECGGYETVPVIQDTLKVKFDGPVGELDVSNATVTLTEKATGEAASVSEIKANAGALTAKIDKFLKKDSEYKLIVSGVKSNGVEIPEYITKFVTNNTEVDGFFSPTFTNSYGDEISAPQVGKIYANTKFINTSDENKSALITIAGYKNTENGPEMRYISTSTISIPAGVLTKVEKDVNEVFIQSTLGKTPDFVKSFVWVSGSDKTPQVLSSCIGTEKGVTVSTTNGAKQIADYYVEASSEIENADAETAVTVCKKGAAYDNNVSFVNQVKSDENKKASVGFNMRSDDPSGDYTVEFAADGKAYKYDFVFINPTEFTALTTELKNSESAEAIKTIIDDNYAKLGISMELFEIGDSQQVAKFLYEDIKANAVKDDWKEESDRVKQLFYISAASEGKLDNVFDYAEELKLEEDDNWQWYAKDFVKTTVQKDITSRIKKTNGVYASVKDFYDKFEESYVLAVVTNPDGEGNLKSVLNNFSEEIGISKNGKSATYRGLVGDVYLTYSDLRSAYNSLEKENNNSGGNSGGSGGGGRGNGGIFNGSTVNKEYENTDSDTKTEPILKNIFDDLNGFEWAEQSIVYLAEKRIITGKESDKFCPADNVTREEFAAMLVRAFASDAEISTVSFSDTEKDAWYIESLGKAISAGIVNGNEDGSFGIDEKITRQDMMVMLKRAIDYSGIVLEAELENVAFNDDAEIADYAKDAVYTLKNARIVNGVTSDTFAPLQSATRAEAAKVIFGVLNV